MAEAAWYRPVSQVPSNHPSSEKDLRTPYKPILPAPCKLLDLLGKIQTQVPLLTVRNLIWLPPLLIDEDDGDENEDFCHDAQEGPERCQAAADTQVHRGTPGAVGVGAVAGILACVLLNIQFKDA